MKKELEVKKSTELVLPEDQACWGTEEITSLDMRLPNLRMVQAQSEIVTDGEAQPGDFINSLTGEIHGFPKRGKTDACPINIVPIYLYKSWVIYSKKSTATKYDYSHIEPYTVANASKPRTSTLGDLDIQNRETINIICMLEKDLGNSSAGPFCISFNMTSLSAGKDIATKLMLVQRAKLPACSATFTISSVTKTNDLGTFFIAKVIGYKETKDWKTYSSDLYQWYLAFKKGTLIVEEEAGKQDLNFSNATLKTDISNKAHFEKKPPSFNINEDVPF